MSSRAGPVHAARRGRHRRRPRRLRAADHAVPIALGGTVAAAALVAPLAATHLRVDARPGISALGAGAGEEHRGVRDAREAVAPLTVVPVADRPGPVGTSQPALSAPSRHVAGAVAGPSTEASAPVQSSAPSESSATAQGKHRKPEPTSEPTSSPEETEDDGLDLPLPTAVPTSLPLPSMTISLP